MGLIFFGLIIHIISFDRFMKDFCIFFFTRFSDILKNMEKTRILGNTYCGKYLCPIPHPLYRPCPVWFQKHPFHPRFVKRIHCPPVTTHCRWIRSNRPSTYVCRYLPMKTRTNCSSVSFQVPTWQLGTLFCWLCLCVVFGPSSYVVSSSGFATLLPAVP